MLGAKRLKSPALNSTLVKVKRSVAPGLRLMKLWTCVSLEMLPIGCAANGDLLVLRFSEAKCAVGLISHDEFWDRDGDQENIYAEVTGSIDEFLWRAAECRYLPIDYYAAVELLEMRWEINDDRGTLR